MYNRLDRKKNPPYIIYNDSGYAFDTFDNMLKQAYLISDNELDLISDNLPEELGQILLNDYKTYSEAKQLLLAIKSII